MGRIPELDPLRPSGKFVGTSMPDSRNIAPGSVLDRAIWSTCYKHFTENGMSMHVMAPNGVTYLYMTLEDETLRGLNRNGFGPMQDFTVLEGEPCWQFTLAIFDREDDPALLPFLFYIRDDEERMKAIHILEQPETLIHLLSYDAQRLWFMGRLKLQLPEEARQVFANALAQAWGQVRAGSGLSPEMQIALTSVRAGSPVGIVIDKTEIEQGDLSSALNVLNLIVQAGMLPALHGKVMLSVHGYDEDRRELFEVPEVKVYFKRLESEFPPLAYALHPSSHPLLMLSYVGFKRVRKKIVPDEQQGAEFLINRAFRTFQIFRSQGLDARKAAREYLEGLGAGAPEDLIEEFERQSR